MKSCRMGRFSVRPSVCRSVRPFPPSRAQEPARLALRPAWLALRPDWLGLRPAWLALGPSKGGWTDGRTYGRTDRLMDFPTEGRKDRHHLLEMRSSIEKTLGFSIKIRYTEVLLFQITHHLAYRNFKFLPTSHRPTSKTG